MLLLFVDVETKFNNLSKYSEILILIIWLVYSIMEYMYLGADAMNPSEDIIPITSK